MLMSGKKKFTGFLNYGPEEKDLFDLLSSENKDMTIKNTFTKEYRDINNGMLCKSLSLNTF